MKKNNSCLRILYRPILLFAFIFCITPSCLSQDKVAISYVGNMGVLIGNEKQAVLIDGFHKEYGPEYLFPSDSLVKKIISGEYYEFGTIDIAIATHQHKDHFDPNYFRSFLDFNESSLAILSSQIKTTLITEIKANKVDLQERIKTPNYDGKVHTFHHEEIDIKAFQCDHVNPSRHGSVENTAYIINIKGISVLHVGDTNWDVIEKHLIKHQELFKYLDVAILPYWMLLEEKSIENVLRLLNPTNLIATHIPPDFEENQKKRISKNFEKVILFTEIGNTIEIQDIRKQ